MDGQRDISVKGFNKCHKIKNEKEEEEMEEEEIEWEEEEFSQ